MKGMASKKLVFLTGSGISAESGLKTFRDADGLWEGYNVYDVATPEAWERDPAMVLEFYNLRRKGLLAAQPNEAHLALARLEEKYGVSIVTQNIDDLHERAGSSKIVHLHGELRKARSSVDSSLVYPIAGWELNLGQKCELGSQLRPDVVWFGEAVPLMDLAEELVQAADILVVIGTSLQVRPAANLAHIFDRQKPLFVIDPGELPLAKAPNTTFIKEKAVSGVAKLIEKYL